MPDAHFELGREGDLDAPKSKAKAALTAAEQALADLMEGVDMEEDWSAGLGDEEADDNLEGDFDVRLGLSETELRELEADLLPLKQVLAKVCVSVPGENQSSP